MKDEKRHRFYSLFLQGENTRFYVVFQSVSFYQSFGTIGVWGPNSSSPRVVDPCDSVGSGLKICLDLDLVFSCVGSGLWVHNELAWIRIFLEGRIRIRFFLKRRIRIRVISTWIRKPGSRYITLVLQLCVLTKKKPSTIQKRNEKWFVGKLKLQISLIKMKKNASQGETHCSGNEIYQ